MKCNQCYQIIPLNEEIKENHKCYCETCYKADSWARTGSKILMFSVLLLVLILFFGVVAYILKDAFGKKKAKDDDE